MDLIASSVEHHPSLRELTVGGLMFSDSLVKGAVEGMARRHGVKKLVANPNPLYEGWIGECL